LSYGRTLMKDTMALFASASMTAGLKGAWGFMTDGSFRGWEGTVPQSFPKGADPG